MKMISALLLALAITFPCMADDCVPIKYATEVTVPFSLYQTSGLEYKVDAAHASGDTQVSIDGAGQNNTTNGFTDEGSDYEIVLTAAETTGKRIMLKVVDQGTKAWIDSGVCLLTYGSSLAYMPASSGGGEGAFVTMAELLVYTGSVTSVVSNSTTSYVRANGSFERFVGGKAWLNADYVSGTTTTLTVTLQHSPDGTNWIDYGVFSQVATTDLAAELDLTTPIYPNVRLKYTTTGTSPSYNFTVNLYGYIRN